MRKRTDNLLDKYQLNVIESDGKEGELLKKQVSKAQLRIDYLQIRKKVNNKKEKSNLIIQKVILRKEYQKAKVIALYKSMESEVDTTLLISQALLDGKIVATPRIEDDTLVFYQITSDTDVFVKSKFGVEEPIPEQDKMMENDKIDLVIVPGVCFDKEKNRLGFGKGYYDQFLERSRAYKLGICFEEQILKDEFIPVEEHDVKMDRIITNICMY